MSCQLFTAHPYPQLLYEVQEMEAHPSLQKKKWRFREAFFSRNCFNSRARKASQQKCHHFWNLGCFNDYKESHDTAAHGHANKAKNGLTVKLRFPCFLG